MVGWLWVVVVRWFVVWVGYLWLGLVCGFIVGCELITCVCGSLACVGMWRLLAGVCFVGLFQFECAVWYCLLITWDVFNSVDLHTSFVLFYLGCC